MKFHLAPGANIDGTYLQIELSNLSHDKVSNVFGRPHVIYGSEYYFADENNQYVVTLYCNCLEWRIGAVRRNIAEYFEIWLNECLGIKEKTVEKKAFVSIQEVHSILTDSIEDKMNDLIHNDLWGFIVGIAELQPKDATKVVGEELRRLCSAAQQAADLMYQIDEMGA